MKHVKGHQDKRVRKEKLTIVERLNIKVDQLIGAKASIPKRFNIKNTPFVVYVNNKFIPNNFVKEIRKYCRKTDTTTYMINKYSWSKKILNGIKWNLQSEFIRKQSYSRRKTITKYCHRWLSAGKKNLCQPLVFPHCHKTEDKDMEHDHFLQYEASENRKLLRMQKCEDNLSRYKTPTRLEEEILEEIRTFYDNNMDKKYKYEPQKTIKDQQKIGWDHFCRGRICKQLSVTMEEYYNNQEKTSSFTERGWSKRIIEFILELYLEEWYFRCTSIESILVNFGDQIISLETRSLLIIIRYFYSKMENLHVEQRKWLKNFVAEYVPFSVKTLRQWIL